MKKTNNHFHLLFAFLGIFFFLSILIVGCGPNLVLYGVLSDVDGQKTGQVGDTFGGTIGPLVALLATLVTFAAFWVQYVANKEQLQQFERQNQNDIIFKLFDDQESRIVNSSVAHSGVEHKSYNTLAFLVKKINEDIDKECLLLARHLICKDPAFATPLFFQKLSDPILPIPSQHDIDTFHVTMAGLDENGRWEHLKHFVGSVGFESDRESDALGSVGRINFYRVDFSERYYIYQKVFGNLTLTYGNFLDGYLKGWGFICNFINESINKDLYIQYLHSRLSKYDKIIIFYFLASGYAPTKLIVFFRAIKVLDDLHKFSSHLIDAPTEDQLLDELSHVYKLAEVNNY